jgi:hypothetical protein
VFQHLYISKLRNPKWRLASISNALLIISFSLQIGSHDQQNYFAIDALLFLLGWRSNLYDPTWMFPAKSIDAWFFLIYLLPFWTWVQMSRSWDSGHSTPNHDEPNPSRNLINAEHYRGYQIVKNSKGIFGVYKTGARVRGSRGYSTAQMARNFVDHFG